MHQSWLLFVFFCVQTRITFVSGVTHPNVSASSFCYDDPDCDASTWGGICETGKEQSPINIHLTEHASSPNRTPLFKMNDLYLYESVHMFFAQNNGHTAQFELNSNTSALKSRMTICGGGLKHCYKFAQLHFHWAEIDSEGSEHSINGTRFPLELHLVHYKSDYSTLADALASDDRQAVAVMAVLFKIGNHNTKLNSIVDALASLRKPGKVTPFHMSLRIADLFPETGAFARYDGSLTTPTCDEKVIWTVFLLPWDISEKQIMKFRLLSNPEGNSDFNFRPTQPLNHRVVEFLESGPFGLIAQTPSE